MGNASGKKREVFDFFKDNAEKIDNDAELLKSAKELVGLFGKVIRGYKLYPRSNPAFTRFADQFTKKLDEILDSIPSISLRISLKGFMVGKSVLETNEKDKEIVFFLYNDGLREIFFQKGTTKEEITQLFNVLAQCTLFANEDYDLATLLWDSNFASIGYITEEELVKENQVMVDSEDAFSPFMVEELAYGPGYDGIGEIDQDEQDGSGGDSPSETATGAGFDQDDFEKFSSLILKERDEIDLNQRREHLDKRILNHTVGKMEMFKFDEALKKNSDSFIVNRFLRELSSRLICSQGSPAGLELLETASSLWERLLLFGSIKGAVLFIKTLKAIAEKLESSQPSYSKKIREGFSSLDDIEFLDDVFSTLEDLPMEELGSIGELLAMAPSSKIEHIIIKINKIESTEVRVTALESLGKFIEVSEELLALTKHEDWKIVRNVLSLLKDKKHPGVIPAIRSALSHPQKQAQVEALALLMEFSIDEALPALEKAVFSSSREIRAVSFRKVLELREPKIKAVINRAMQVHNLKKLENDEIDEYFKLIIDLRREDMYDILANNLFSEDMYVKNKIIAAILNAPTLTPFAKFIAKASDFTLISKMKINDVKYFCKLFKPETYKELFPYLEKLFSMKGGFFNKNVTILKETVIKSLVLYVDDAAVIAFFRNQLAVSNKETKSLINKYAAKYL